MKETLMDVAATNQSWFNGAQRHFSRDLNPELSHSWTTLCPPEPQPLYARRDVDNKERAVEVRMLISSLRNLPTRLKLRWNGSQKVGGSNPARWAHVTLHQCGCLVLVVSDVQMAPGDVALLLVPEDSTCSM